ncbi:FAD binding domain-containing protein [Streptomyces sp. NPDC127051]|uniref:FAD binding domain-containing protein n=1 Tax=Streptomyces sp. NPDC127051 TaxID=3347119 RepID=UPI003669686D
MKPPSFRYHAPTSLDEALGLLARYERAAMILAGGQSLIPLLNARRVGPEHVVDINRIRELDYVRTAVDGVRIGAVARQARLEHDVAARAALPLIAQTLPWVGRPATRNRGTVVGSLAHADPAAELPCIFTLMEGTVSLARAGGTRSQSARQFFMASGEERIAPDEIVFDASLPAVPPRSGTAFAEVSRRKGDLPVCAVASFVAVDARGHIESARVTCAACGPCPVTTDLTSCLTGAAPHEAPMHEAARRVQAAISPCSDIHADAAYRRHLAGILASRTLRSAAAECLRNLLATAEELKP